MSDEGEELSLSELKKRNAAVEQEAVPETPEVPEPEQDVPVEGEQESTEEDESTEEAEPSDDWLQADDESEAPAPKFTDSDVAKLRRKMQGKLSARNEENAELKRKLEELEKRVNAPAPAPTPGAPQKPIRDKYDDDDAYIEALTDYKIAQASQKAQSQQTAAERQRAQQEEQTRVSSALDQHYERAAKLAQQSAIKPETYQAADLRVREAIETVFSGAGDAITDNLIARMGAGSEKVFYHLGVNQAKREELVKQLRADPTGLGAAIYLGKLNASLSAPAKRDSKAPEPIEQIRGDKSGGTAGTQLKRKYEDAHKRGDGQSAFTLKRQAKAAGVDTSSW